MKKKNLILILIAFNLSALFAVGPGNVSSGLTMWLDANSLGLADGTAVSSWTDLSGNAKHALQDTLSCRPIYKTNLISGKPAVVFNGSTSYLNFDGNLVVNTNYTIIAVVKRSSNAIFNFFLGGSNPIQQKNMHIGWRTNNTFTHAQYTNDYDMRMNNYVSGEAPIIVSLRHSNTLGNDTYINGGLRGLNMNTATSGRLAHLAEWTGSAIGKYYGGTTTHSHFNGWVTEFIIYNRYLSDTERKTVENYLSTKYALTLANTTSPEHYTDMIEISLPGAGSVTQATDGLTIKGTYISAFARIRAGHDIGTGTTAASNPSIVSYPHFLRLHREWFMEFSGSLNTIFSFNLDNLGLPSFTPGGSDYRLLFRNDTKDNYSIVTGSPTIVGRVISFTVNPLTSVTNNGFYTLGTLNDVSSELPVELSSFTAVSSTSQLLVNLQWTTESETNNLGFNILRTDGSNISDGMYVNSSIIPGTNTSTLHTYTFSDPSVEAPHTYYYWLENIDFGGISSFTGPVMIQVHEQDNPNIPPVIPMFTKLNPAYPNPFNPETNISFTLKTPCFVNIAIYDIKGRKIQTLTSKNWNEGSHNLIWNGKDETGKEAGSGVYFYHMIAGKYSSTQKVVLMK